jgi:hypothetical protein
MRELENARLVRLLTKFGFINERPEYVPSPLTSLLTDDDRGTGSTMIRGGQRREIDTLSSCSEISSFTKSTRMGDLSRISLTS